MLKTETRVFSRISRKFFSNNNNPIRVLSRSASSQISQQNSIGSLTSSLSSSDSGEDASDSNNNNNGSNIVKRRKSSPENDINSCSKIKLIEDAIDKKYGNAIERDECYCLYFNKRYNKWTIEKKTSPVMVVTYDSKVDAVEAYKKFILSSPEVK